MGLIARSKTKKKKENLLLSSKDVRKKRDAEPVFGYMKNEGANNNGLKYICTKCYQNDGNAHLSTARLSRITSTSVLKGYSVKRKKKEQTPKKKCPPKKKKKKKKKKKS